ncbi:SDR family oxidoreductase [Erwinia tracheiphila]|uniref:Oxidoreductase n=1 Tax=Erwinia tracheiphila TaxID=65700 RepID=A0A345CPL3_9GAMM|nr:SDR family oxidoreductase [Erwinia tracheiphila]AXF75380.1 oxidoreductase [Erwinia tracheiphila]UIA82077.1 SDR family oxidoreductase [Erwinia tracheiphila]UIA90672.1 SDR family oxidoreductase [Erwinia tracheiphila]
MQKNIVITGCSSGIGLTAANNLLQRGYRVFATCRKPQDVGRMNQLGFIGIELDLNDRNSVARAAEQIINLSNNRLFALFNNGGYGVYGQLECISREQIEQQFATNLFGTHQLTILLLPALRASGNARIINTSSVLGVISTPGRGAYAASKYALEAWSDALRMELYGSGVRVSLIEPGPIKTFFTDNVHQTQRARPVKNPGIAARFALTPDAILPKLHHALESRHPRLRYPVTLVAHAMTLLRRLLPGWMLDRILRGKPADNVDKP